MADLVAYTTACSEHGHPEFRLQYNDNLVTEDDLHFLVGRLEASVADGMQYGPGSTLQIGWVVLRCRALEDGRLVVQEPDMVHTPLWWIDSVNHCLLHRRLQRGVCASVLAAGDIAYPASDQRASVAGCFADASETSMLRFEGGDGHSGWLFGCGSPDHLHDPGRDCAQMPLYEVAVGYDPRVIPYLGLPVGVQVVMGADGPRISRDGEALALKPGSLLDANFGRT